MDRKASSGAEKRVLWRRLVIFRLVCLARDAPQRSARASLSPRKLDEPNGRFRPARCSSIHSIFPYCEYFQVTKLYVGNLPFTATDEAVNALFSKHGTVEKVSLINDRDTGRPRGFGFVEMSNADASRAMQALNGTDFEGRALKVSEAQERERSGGGRRY